MTTYRTKDLEGLRLIKGRLPIDTASDTLLRWAQEGFTEGDNELAKVFRCDFVFGSKESISAAKKKYLRQAG